MDAALMLWLVQEWLWEEGGWGGGRNWAEGEGWWVCWPGEEVGLGCSW